MAFKKLSIKQPKAVTKNPHSGSSFDEVYTEITQPDEDKCCVCGKQFASCLCDKTGEKPTTTHEWKIIRDYLKSLKDGHLYDLVKVLATPGPTSQPPPSKPAPVKIAAGMPPDDNTNTPLLVADENKLQVGKMYVKLFHGRNKPDEELHDWGFEGPTFGPLDYFQNTYNCHPRGGYYDGLYEELLEIGIFNDLYVYDGKYYGDISVFIHQEEGKY